MPRSPKFDYCCQLCLPTELNNVKLIESIQGHFIKRSRSTRSFYVSYFGMVNQLNPDILEKRSLQLDLILLCGPICGFCHFDVFMFITSSSNAFENTRECFKNNY